MYSPSPCVVALNLALPLGPVDAARVHNNAVLDEIRSRLHAVQLRKIVRAPPFAVVRTHLLGIRREEMERVRVGIHAHEVVSCPSPTISHCFATALVHVIRVLRLREQSRVYKECRQLSARLRVHGVVDLHEPSVHTPIPYGRAIFR